MRSLALTVLLGSFVASTCLSGQSLTEHAAAAAGATIGTAAGKPLGTSLGKIFGDVDKNTSTAATPKPAKIVMPKTAPVALPETTEHTATVVLAPSGGAGVDGGPIGGGSAGASHRAARRSVAPPVAEAPISPVITPVVAPEIKEPSVQDVASVHVGATSSELRELLGAPESRVSIPDDDGHLLEICQYWAKGEQLGTIRLDNGHVVSVQVNN